MRPTISNDISRGVLLVRREKDNAVGVTLLHVANIRLGSAFPLLGARGRDQRASLVQTLLSLTDLAQIEQASAVLISGDLFGCAIPAPSTIKVVQAFFAKLRDTGIATVILPGTRDPEGIFDPARQRNGQEVSPGATILDAYHPSARLGTTSIMVRAVQPTTVSQPRASLAEPDMLVVGMTYHADEHGADHINALGRAFAASGLRYLGLGGDTRFTANRFGDLVVCSPGVPEPMEWDQEEGSVAIVRVSDAGQIQVERARTGTKSFARREIEITPDNARDVVDLIRPFADPNLGLEVVLRGTCPARVLIDPADIEIELAQSFFYLRIVDRTGLVIDTSGPAAFPPGTVVGHYARIADERIRAATDEEEVMLEREAYRLGLSLLQEGARG